MINVKHDTATVELQPSGYASAPDYHQGLLDVLMALRKAVKATEIAPDWLIDQINALRAGLVEEWGTAE
jgi:hypothetical protein